ncbi:major head protein [Synechococcus phage S-CBP2]|uniref:Major capsid protein n=1 Tax=Synechococcus phage S-CBP2 TaxID=756277 RepID=A0A096VL01_9CAUD|nr:major head protein [Synechococcus phage S-CBP2]AGF91083.1 major capsid protein [Synechococcus phage MRHenn-2013a]AGK86740.1 major capsid protein [Synechococcus phage S-CBP2]
MTNVNLTRPGQVNQAGDSRALLLKLFTGEVYEAFRNNLLAKSLVQSRTLRNGKEAQFIHTGKMTAGFHTPGSPILGNGTGTNGAPPQAETTITVDQLLISSAFLYELDEVLAHYDLRGPISRQIGQALAEHYDRRVLRVLDQASAASAPVTGEPGGFQVKLGANNEYNAQALVDGFFEAAAVLDERSAPRDGRCAVLSPRQYYSLISSVDTNILNRDIGNTQGNLNSGEGLYEIAGIKIYKSNNLPFLGKYGTSTGPAIENTDTNNEKNSYGDTADFANSCGLIFHRDAAAVVETIGPSVETTSGDVSVMYQGDLIVGKVAMGAGPVRVSVAGAFRNIA